MALVLDPVTGALVEEKTLKQKQKQDKIQEENKKDLATSSAFDETTLDIEANSEVGGATAFVAGLASGTIKTAEGVVSLGAELLDLGAGTDVARDVEQFFDKINPFEEIAEQRAVGRLTEALVQIGVPATAGAKLATKLASKAIRAKKAGQYASFKSKNIKKGAAKAKQLNDLSGTQRFAAIVASGS